MFLVHAKIFFFFTIALALALALAFLCKEYMESIEGNQKQFFSPCQRTALQLRCTKWRVGGKKKRTTNLLVILLKLAVTYSPTWYSSTIGADGLNFSVRYG